MGLLWSMKGLLGRRMGVYHGVGLKIGVTVECNFFSELLYYRIENGSGKTDRS